MPVYKQQKSGDGQLVVGVVRDGVVFIPNDPLNADWREYLVWASQNNTTQPADSPGLTYSLTRPINARVKTTDAVATELYRSTLTPMTGYTALLRAIGVDSGNGACRVVLASVLVKRLNAGAVMVGTPIVLANHADTGATGWVLAASVSGNDFVVTVTGATGRTIDWSLGGDVQSFTPAGV